MTQNIRKGEILAPAGSIEQLVAAVNNGCDSVYLGMNSFNARMKAPNFTKDNIEQWIDYCHLFGVKVYVAINTSLKNDEFTKAVDLLKYVYERNADGVILTDLALIRIAAMLPKPFDVVASTQLNTHDRYGAAYLRDLGATTVVCARESSLNEIKEIVLTGVNVECFIHGATCVCQSGQCLFSAMVGGNSGNRGMCAQPCRKLYSADFGRTFSYLLSAKDLCGLNIADKLYQSGVNVYKIEGRNRRAEYAGVTSRVYRSHFDSDFATNKYDRTQLAEVYNRGMGTLSYLSGDNCDVIYPYAQNHIGVRVGAIRNGLFYAETEVVKGDGLKVLDGLREVCGGIVKETGRGVVAAEFSAKVADGMEVRRTSSVKQSEEVANVKRRIPIKVLFTAYANQTATLTAIYDKLTISVASDTIVEKAIKSPTNRAEITQQLQKTGNTCYTITDIDIKINQIFIAKSQINALRRQLLDKLDSAIIKQYNSRFSSRANCSYKQIDSLLNATCYANYINSLLEKNNVLCDCLEKQLKKSSDCTNNPVIAVTCYNVDQLEKVHKLASYLIYKPAMIDVQSVSETIKYNAFLDLPSFADTNFLSNLFGEKKVGVVCHNVGHVGLARQLNLPYIVGSGMNIYNDFIAAEFADAETFVFSHELTLYEIEKMHSRHGIIFVDGDITLMRLVHCPFKLVYNCNCSNCKAGDGLTYQDELGNKFAIKRRKDSRCTFELINGNKLSVIAKITNKGRYQIDFDESVINHYVSLNNEVCDGHIEQQPYTKGRLYNKVN